jgi:hypothetical protein
MILKNTKAIQFLKPFFSENECIQIHRNIFFFPSAGIGFFSGVPSKKILSKQNPDIIWITSNRWFFRKNLCSSLTFYLLTKKKTHYTLCDRRYLKSKAGPYLLPPTPVTLNLFPKTPFLKQKEEELFSQTRSSSFYCEGDSISRLNSPSYLQRLEEKSKKPYIPIKLSTKIFLFLKGKLDG